MSKAERIPRQVWLFGWASLFTDAATEMIYPLLPVYLSRVLGAGALSLGIIEGVAEGVNSVLKIASGWLSDRASRRRRLVILGYGISSAARPLIAAATSWTHVLLIRSIDRTGKGIRSAPRDAMLARLARPESRGRIFGFHRAMDHAGAIVGPLLATLFLYFLPGRFRLLFSLTIIPGAIAVAVLWFIREEERLDPAAPLPEAPPAARATASAPAGGSRLPGRFWAVLGVILIFSLGSSADAFLLLRLSDVLGSATFVPLLWSALHVVKSSLSTWGGALSDHFGRPRVIVLGWLVYAAVYLGFALSTSPAAFVAWFLFYGVYFALTEGAEKALIADIAPPDKHGTAFGLYNAALGGGALTASIAFGLVYEHVGSPAAFGMGAGFAALASVLLPFVPNGIEEQGRLPVSGG